MADFDAQEVSVFGGRPVELYEFALEGATFRFNNTEESIIVAAQTYLPGGIRRDNVEQSNKQITGSFELHWALTNGNTALFLSKWIATAPEGDVEITIKKFHVTDTPTPEVITFWTGKLMDVAYADNEAIMLVSNVSSFFTDKGPRMSWGGHCGHNFGDELCGFVLSTVTRTLTVASVAADGITVTITDLSTGQTNGDYIRGELRLGAFTRRYITQHTGDVIVLLYPVPDLGAGDTIEVVEGCPHNVTACDTRFTNIINYGGSPNTPNINPFERTLDKM
jgi:uncharacterized phage protein (TIGR02218 family)